MRYCFNLINIIFVFFLSCLNAYAQVTPGEEPLGLQNRNTIDSHGVDMVGREPTIMGVNLSIGNGSNGLSISDSSFNGLRTEYKGAVTYLQSTGREGGCEFLPEGQFLSVSTGNSAAVFEYKSGVSELTRVRGKGRFIFSTVSTFIDLDGTEYKYELFSLGDGFSGSFSNLGSGCSFRKPIATLTKIIKPSGEVIDINYEKSPTQDAWMFGPTTFGYFASVKSSLGWIFKRETKSTSGAANTTAGVTIKKEFVFANLAYEYCNSGSSVTCSGLALPWAKYILDENYSHTGGVNNIQKIVTYTGDLKNPLGKQKKLNYTFKGLNGNGPTINTSVETFPTGLKRTYKWSCVDDPFCPETLGSKKLDEYSQGAASFYYGTLKLETNSYANQSIIPHDAVGPDGKIRFIPILSNYPFGFYDNKNRLWGQNYADNTYLLKEVGYRGDSRTIAEYDDRGNVTLVALVTKNNTTGTSIGGLVVLTPVNPSVDKIVPLASATYPDASLCSTSPKTCNKPTTITDKNGVTSTYTYHAQTGFVETITKPAVNNVQAQTRYKYEQKTPYVKSSSGGMVANPPVWVLTEISECMTKTLNTCVGTADEKRIVYSDFTNNLLPKTMVIRSGNDQIHLETQTEYDIYGNVVAVDGPRDGMDDKVFYFYDLMRNKIGEIGIDPDGSGSLPRQAMRYTYNDDGKLTSIEKGTVSGTTIAYLNAMQAKEQSTTEYSTDHGLPIVERYYAAGVLERVTQKSYDSNLRVDCVAQRLHRNAWSTLPPSACTLELDPEGNDRITKYSYDATGAVLSITSAYGTSLARKDRTNTYRSENGLLATEADAKGNTTFYVYDEFNRPYQTIYPSPSDGKTKSSTDYTQTNYKEGSSLVDSVRLRDGLTVRFSNYDALGRVASKSGALSETFTYNNFNQVVTHTNNSTGGVSQTSTYTYKSVGWLERESRVAGGVSLGGVSYGYDDYGRRTSLTWSDGFTVKYDYLVNNVPSEYLRKITESNGTLLASFDYYDNGHRKSLTRGNGVVTNYGYNDQLQLSSLATNVGGSATADDISETFTYNTAGQLKSRTFNVSNNNYRYMPAATGTTSYTPDALNRISNLNGNQFFCYDGRGNLTREYCNASASNTMIYAYNANNLLLNASVSAANVSISLSYDAENRLYSVIGPGTTTKFMYDGTDLIAETNGGNGILRRYVHGPETDDPIVWYEGSGTGDKRYYTTDRQGSIVGVTKADGTSLSVGAYDEYGKQSNTAIGRFQYTGQTWIPELGLYYYKARFYNPNLGRFMQTDPIGYKDGMNWYAYVGNDPVNKTDPTGMWSPDAHDKILKVALEKKVTEKELKTIQKSSREFDKKTQGKDQSHMHSMAKKGQSPDDAKKERDKFVSGKLDEAKKKNEDGDRNGALVTFGEAMHPVMDSSSPEHTDANGNPKVWTGLKDAWGHSPVDWVGNETSKDLTPQILESQTKQINDAYTSVFGNE